MGTDCLNIDKEIVDRLMSQPEGPRPDAGDYHAPGGWERFNADLSSFWQRVISVNRAWMEFWG